MENATLRAELELLDPDSLAIRCRRNGLSREGDRADQIQRLINLQAYLSGDVQAQPLAPPAVDEALQVTSCPTPTGINLNDGIFVLPFHMIATGFLVRISGLSTSVLELSLLLYMPTLVNKEGSQIWKLRGFNGIKSSLHLEMQGSKSVGHGIKLHSESYWNVYSPYKPAKLGLGKCRKQRGALRVSLPSMLSLVTQFERIRRRKPKQRPHFQKLRSRPRSSRRQNRPSKAPSRNGPSSTVTRKLILKPGEVLTNDEQGIIVTLLHLSILILQYLIAWLPLLPTLDA